MQISSVNNQTNSINFEANISRKGIKFLKTYTNLSPKDLEEIRAYKFPGSDLLKISFRRRNGKCLTVISNTESSIITDKYPRKFDIEKLNFKTLRQKLSRNFLDKTLEYTNFLADAKKALEYKRTDLIRKQLKRWGYEDIPVEQVKRFINHYNKLKSS